MDMFRFSKRIMNGLVFNDATHLSHRFSAANRSTFFFLAGIAQAQSKNPRNSLRHPSPKKLLYCRVISWKQKTSMLRISYCILLWYMVNMFLKICLESPMLFTWWTNPSHHILFKYPMTPWSFCWTSQQLFDRPVTPHHCTDTPIKWIDDMHAITAMHQRILSLLVLGATAE